MAQTKNCKNRTRHFVFDMPVNNEGVFCGNMTIEGFGCKRNGHVDADIDSIEYEGTEIKPVLEMMGGMELIDATARNHVSQLFEYQLA